MNRFSSHRLTVVCRRLFCAAVLLAVVPGCQKEPSPEAQQAAAREQVEQLERELWLKKSSLSTVEKKIGDPGLNNLQPALLRLREKIRGEISELSTALEQKRGTLGRYQ